MLSLKRVVEKEDMVGNTLLSIFYIPTEPFLRSSPCRWDPDRLRSLQAHRHLPFDGERQHEVGQRSPGDQLLRHRQLAGDHGGHQQGLQQSLPLRPGHLHHQTPPGNTLHPCDPSAFNVPLSLLNCLDRTNPSQFPLSPEAQQQNAQIPSQSEKIDWEWGSFCSEKCVKN